MKLTLETKAFDGLLSAARGVVATKSTWDVLKAVRIEAHTDSIELRSTDLARELTILAKAQVHTPGALLVEHGALADWVKALAAGSQILIESDGDCLVAKSGRARYRVQTLPLETFPPFGAIEAGVKFAMAPSDLARMLKLTIGCVSTDETAYYLNGVYLHRRNGALRTVATQKHIMAFAGIPEPEGADAMEGVILPSDSVRTLIALLEGAGTLSVEIGRNLAIFETERWRLATKLIEGEYPDISRLETPPTDRTAYADAEELSAAIRRVAIASELDQKRTRMIYLDFQRDGLTISAHALGATESVDVIDIALEGKPVRKTFNAAYLRALIDAFKFGRVEMRVGEAEIPMLMRSPTAPDSDRALIMGIDRDPGPSTGQA